ncbi:D-beta-hydroxybutyrate dehydrogenase-like [Physella acuta]|uniref:D-beta-hydroxybutyrate dehydrogenase-like n=1 Tax=Physella acuta TaxID=109671 RepID=UPI0027DD5002|nr:D-beta-hydroxybutyrate dehydrogenase-like [Physella acuta]
MAETLKGKVALVTGSTTGIGKGIAHCLASKGCSVVLTGLIEESKIEDFLQEFTSKYNGEFKFIPGDFLETTKTEQFAKDVLDAYPDGVDILVNNAGLPGRGLLESFPTEVWLDTLAVNLTAPFILTRAFFPSMKKKGWGRVINMASQMGLIADPGKSAYCASKAGLIGFSRVVAIEGARFGVTCNAVCPGYVDAPMGLSQVEKLASETGMTVEESKAEFADKRTPMGRLIPISEVAELIAFLCSDSASSISGTPIPIDAANMAR